MKGATIGSQSTFELSKMGDLILTAEADVGVGRFGCVFRLLHEILLRILSGLLGILSQTENGCTNRLKNLIFGGADMRHQRALPNSL